MVNRAADLSMPRVFDDPVAEPRGAAGGRSNNIIISVRRDRPSSSVRPDTAECALSVLGWSLWDLFMGGTH